MVERDGGAGFTECWWNQPWFYPTTGVTAFTEHLTGLAPIATPAYWLTDNPVLPDNVTFFASWPLSAFGVYFLVRRITRRTDAGILAGLAYGFSPYRTAELGHLQSLAVYWLPMALGALHAYIDERRTRWLVLFAVAWLMQSLTNGYVMLFGAVLRPAVVVLLLLVTREVASLPPVLLAWGLGSLPLVPILLEYQRIHDQFGLLATGRRSARVQRTSRLLVSGLDFVRVWGGVLPAGKDDLFPGITVVLLTVVALIIALSRRDPHAGQISRRRRVVLAGLSLVVLSSVTALVAMLAVGPWSITRGDWVLFKMGDPYRALALLAICGLPLLFLFPLTRRMLQQRHPFVFYSVATLLMALFACGPVLAWAST